MISLSGLHCSLNEYFPSQSLRQEHILGKWKWKLIGRFYCRSLKSTWSVGKSICPHFSASLTSQQHLFCKKHIKVLKHFTCLASPWCSCLLETLWGELKWVRLDTFADLDSLVPVRYYPLLHRTEFQERDKACPCYCNTLTCLNVNQPINTAF